ncbi:hypothetical protein DSM3645_17385 [Blastopirellula marina DSM 3645]|uniref:Uncharacterized protein n=1 Tax=Blastopirellula marina DSM 3645 TaxID=314230 RepID=A3ZNP9_9BACT|nr:hypothetical protein DSM3645_17385 [Blastopirellula marina DSM 3645]
MNRFPPKRNAVAKSTARGMTASIGRRLRKGEYGKQVTDN